MKRIAIDMDEVMADALGEHLLRYNRGFGESLTPADLAGKWLWDAVPASRHRMLEKYLRAGDFFAELDVIPGAQRVIQRLQARYEVFIATAAMQVPTSFAAKFAWLERHFPFIPHSHIVFCGDKSILHADFLIDDNEGQLERFNGEGILFSAPHNAHVTGFRRVNNWDEVEAMFLGSAAG